MRLSIRWRLTLWNTIALAVVLLGFTALVYGLLRNALYEQLDRKLLAGLQQIDEDPRLPQDVDARLRHWLFELYEHDGILAVVYGSGGPVRLRTQELAEGSILPAPLAAPTRFVIADRVVPMLGRQRVLDGRLRCGSEVCTVRLMAPLAGVDHELAELMAALVLAVPAALVVSAAAGYFLARKALGPVEQLRRQTREITADRLDRRLPVLNPDDELGRLAATINAMIGRLEHSFAEVRRFTADASHELRTPLTALRAEIEAALRRPGLPDHQQGLLISMLEECQRLTRLTDQLLMLCREDSGAVPRADEPLDLAALVHDATETMRPLADEKGLRLHIDCTGPGRIRGDAARLRRVVYNLVENAVKYTRSGGTVEVRTRTSNDAATLTVRDTGIGIPAEHLPRVLDRFYRVDKGRSREQEGTGLGLSIARSIVVAHGGTIDVESTPGHGTICTVTLPRRAGGRNEEAET